MAEDGFADAVARAQRGAETGFVVLFRSAQPAVLRYLRVVAGPERAEDLASETWVEVVRSLGRFAGEDADRFRAWTIGIARHRWLTDVRSRTRRPEHPVADVPEQASYDDVATSVETVVTTEAALDLIATLPPDQAEAVTLRVVADLDVAAVAQAMGRSAGAVRVLVHRGLRRLEQTLGTGVTPTRRTAKERER